MTSAFERIGEARLRAIIRDFVRRVATDPMIGFFFAKVDLARLEEKEYEHAAEHLGAEGVTYGGKPLAAAHGPHRIFGGQFARRKEILRQVLAEHGVDEETQRAWLDHVESLRAQITRDPGSECR